MKLRKPLIRSEKRRWFILGESSGEAKGLKEREILEKREIDRQAKYNEQMSRLGNIVKLARQEADRIIEIAHEDADEILSNAKQKLVISTRNYTAIMRHRDNIESIAQAANGRLMDANKIWGDASSEVMKSKIEVGH